MQVLKLSLRARTMHSPNGFVAALGSIEAEEILEIGTHVIRSLKLTR